ncbi:RNA polymerase sigma factor [Temperatibacter marinus]|uniref:RNA polymerase sigma factor n=1 Tax=Temperatibacter marinus TaxID=1456591 RepID=A0AA52EC80_9PROT|nr:RNA polymerase sigma factor [Temperatibacter marinus]WND02116.1 RNA polymerase sigma factor [Temperatibacter marinus]
MSVEAEIESHSKMIGRIASSYERDDSLRQDLLQEIVIALLISLPKYRGEGTKKAFIARVAQNTCLTHVRKQVSQKMQTYDTVEVEDDRIRADDRIEQQQKSDALQAAVRGLPIKLRQVIILALEGLSYREIGESIGISENNVGVRFTRAKGQLIQLMGKE